MSKIILVLSTLSWLVACGDAGMQHNVHVSKGDPNRRERPPIRREKSGTVLSKFTQLGIEVQCPTDCAKDFEDQLQFLNVAYSDFQKEKNRIDHISLVSGAEISFDAKNQTMTLPSNLQQLDVDTALVAQQNVERVERLIGNIRLSFPTDRFAIGTIQKALAVLSAPVNVRKVRGVTGKIRWIDFSAGGKSCANGTWSVDRSAFENQFDSAFAALQLCLKTP